jgi:putative MATE family efflux protein
MIKTLQSDDRKGFYQYMLRLALPVALQNLLMAAFQLIDSAMVSRLGDTAMAGVGMAGRWSFIMMITLFGINSGAAILYSQYRGVKDEAGIRRVYGLALLNTMAFVFLFGLAMELFPSELVRVFAGSGTDAASAATAAEIVRQGKAFMQIIAFNSLFMGFNYATTIMLRSTEEVRIPLYTGLLAVAINTSLNFLLIYGNLGMPRMGVRGAGVSTLISSFVQMVVLIVVLRRKKHPVFMHLKGMFNFTREMKAKFYRVAMPVFINESLWSLGTSIYMFVFGRVGGETGVPAYTLYSGIDQLLFSFVIGLASACGVMVGKAVGAGDEDRAWSYSKRFLLLGTLFAILMGAAEILLRVPLINLINPENPLTGELAKKLIIIGGIALPFRMLSMLLIVAIFRAGGKPTLGAAVDVGSIWLVGAPIVLVAGFVLKLPFLWIFALMFTEEVIKNILGFIFFIRRKWMVRLTDAPEEIMPIETEAY